MGWRMREDDPMSRDFAQDPPDVIVPIPRRSDAPVVILNSRITSASPAPEVSEGVIAKADAVALVMRVATGKYVSVEKVIKAIRNE